MRRRSDGNRQLMRPEQIPLQNRAPSCPAGESSLAMFLGHKTICIGDRKSFLDRLEQALELENAVPLEVARAMIGLHLIVRSEAHLADGVIYIDDDTYLGKSISGPPDLVERIAKFAFGIMER